MEKARNGKTVYSRKDDTQDWDAKTYDSISQAKKANGLNSRTVTKAPANPVREEAEAA
ncbi:MAG: hypothetical protein NUV51_03610 [Sulfuricaulis sp.]|nr:hypothetical protein [Sulfuricaulis sp.]